MNQLDQSPTEKKKIQSICRAIAVLRCFHEKRELSLTEISQMLDLHKSTASTIINTLKAERFLEQDQPHGKYKLGLDIFRLALDSQLEFSELCEPYLDTLLRLTNETIIVGVREGLDIVCVSKKESAHSLQVNTKRGTRFPIHCTSLGKAILSVSDPAYVSKFIQSAELNPYTDNTITDAPAFLRELETIREHGLAYNLDELEVGLVALAAPIYYKPGHPVGAVSVLGPSMRMGDDRLAYIGTHLREVCAAINDELGRIAFAR